MADVLGTFRVAYGLAEAAGLTPEEIAFLLKMGAKNPNIKVIIPTPGTEPKLNGVTVADLSAEVLNTPEGQPIPTVRELVVRLAGNPKSNRDKSKILKLLPHVPEIQFIPGRKTQMLRRLTDQRTLDNPDKPDKK